MTERAGGKRGMSGEKYGKEIKRGVVNGECDKWGTSDGGGGLPTGGGRGRAVTGEWLVLLTNRDGGV